MQIDKNIPIPKLTSGRPGKWPPILKELKVGDSFFIAANYQPPAKSELISLRSNITTCARTKVKIRITSRERTENGVIGIRFWRIE